MRVKGASLTVWRMFFMFDNDASLAILPGWSNVPRAPAIVTFDVGIAIRLPRARLVCQLKTACIERLARTLVNVYELRAETYLPTMRRHLILCPQDGAIVNVGLAREATTLTALDGEEIDPPAPALAIMV
jgi:hypothetical protein